MGRGGAERQLVVLAKGLATEGNDVRVMVFYSDGSLQADLEDSEVKVIDLNKKGRWDFFSFVHRLIKEINTSSPDVLYSFMGNANVVTVIAKPFIKVNQIVWGIRASNVDLDHYDWLSKLNYRVESFFSRFADRIISNSSSGCDYAISNGFPESKICVIPNGIDIEQFKPDQVARNNLRKEWKIQNNEILIGLVARVDPMKDHKTFLHAAKLVSDKIKNVRFICVGWGSEDYVDELKKLTANLSLDNVFIWAGERKDMLAVYNALDIATLSSSFGEGFPNVIGEAMACGKPCVVTDVGDSAFVIGDQGLVVPAGDPECLASAMTKLVNDKVLFDTDSIRERIVTEFSIEKLVNETERVLASKL